MTVAERIKYRRDQLGISAVDLAATIGISKATLYRYESGYISKIPYKSITKFCEALNCDYGYLMGWQDKPRVYNTTDLYFEGVHIDDHQKKWLCEMYDKLSNAGQEKIIERIEELLKLEGKENERKETT